MSSYFTPTYVKGNETGLVQGRVKSILPDDAYPTLQNMFLFRETIRRKSGCRLLGRLQRILMAQPLGNLDGAGDFSGDIRVILGLEATGELIPGSITLSDGVNTYTDDGAGILTGVPGGTGIINYVTMAITISGGAAGGALTATFDYAPGLPVMGIRQRELNDINNEMMIVFDTVYAYRFTTQFVEFLPGTTWTGTDSDFFWSTNYWVGDGNLKIFWVTNFSGTTGDPIRYTNGSVWVNFAPQINAAGDVLAQCLCLLPYRGRLLAFNTFEGPNLAGSVQFRQRIRWSAIGNPFTTVSAAVTVVNANAWRDDIPGQGGFLDIPTSENIVSVGFVRDNLVVFCESSTWQLRYTGRTINPFQIEKVNTELGAESTFSAVQFDTSLVGIGDKGVVECDSYQSTRIDIKIPDLVFRYNNVNDGPKRVHGIRDFQQRVSYWTYPEEPQDENVPYDIKFPNRRLLYNYENDSWAIFIDSYTALGTYQPQQTYRWIDFPGPEDSDQWQNLNFQWNNQPERFPAIVGGNQQGFVEFLGQYGFQFEASNDISLTITGITGNTTTPTTINSPNHNLTVGQIIEIVDIPVGTPFASSLNDQFFYADVIDADNFNLLVYSPLTDQFSTPQLDPPGTYVGGGKIAIRDNFRVVSKKFNFVDQGENIQLGYIDILLNNTDDGAITMNVYVNYNDTQPVNAIPQSTDPFFNTIIPTNAPFPQGSSKNWQRIYCNTRGSFITVEYTLSNAQMVGPEQNNDVQIESQVLWMRAAGRQLTVGV